MICLPSVKLIVVIYDKPCVVLMPPAPLAQGLSIYPLTMDSYVGGIKRTWVERQLPPYHIYYLALQTSGSRAYFCVIVNIYILQIHNIHIKPMSWLSLSWVSSSNNKCVLYHHNIRGFNSKRQALENIVKKLSPTIITLNETAMKHEKKPKLNNYISSSKNRSKQIMGGVCTLVKSEFKDTFMKVAEGCDI